jgi:filamentous hemagglutinin
MANINREVQGILDTAREQGFSRVEFPRGAGAARGAVPEGYVPVSRWVSEGESRLWLEGGGTHIPSEAGTLVEPGNLRLYVTNPGAPQPGNTGPVRIDFYVPGGMVRRAGNVEWQQIIQPVANTPIYNVQVNLP